MTIDDYKKDWILFEKYVEKKAKNRCVINNKNWLKLRDYHFENFIKNVPHPYGFVFKIVHTSDLHKNIPCIYKFYYKYKRQRQEQLSRSLGLKTKASAFKKYR